MVDLKPNKFRKLLVLMLLFVFACPFLATARSETVFVHIDKYCFELELNKTDAAKLFKNFLPATIEMKRWGDQFYGSSPVQLEQDLNAMAAMGVGDVAYWPPGGIICIFFGPTPSSPGPTPQFASPGMVLGQLKGDISVLRELGSKTTAYMELK